jgi:hypothetical protein
MPQGQEGEGTVGEEQVLIGWIQCGGPHHLGDCPTGQECIQEPSQRREQSSAEALPADHLSNCGLFPGLDQKVELIEDSQKLLYIDLLAVLLQIPLGRRARRGTFVEVSDECCTVRGKEAVGVDIGATHRDLVAFFEIGERVQPEWLLEIQSSCGHGFLTRFDV